MTRILLLVLFSLLTTGCTKQADTKPAPTKPAKVEKLPVETEIGRITLTPQAEQRLGIVLEPITKGNVQRRRTLGGDVLIPIGKSVIVSAPFSGTVSPPQSSAIPTPGQRVEIGSEILSLAPILTPERDVPTPAEQVQMANARATLLSAIAVAQGDMDRSRAELDGAKITLDRAQKLFKDRAGARRAVDDAQAVLNVSDSNLKAATERERQLSRLVAELDTPASERKAVPLTLAAPQTGVLRSLAVTPGQAVTAGATMFEVVDTDTMWIRVPVYVEMLNDIDTQKNVQIVALGKLSSGNQSDRQINSSSDTALEITAKPVAAPPSADALSSSVDLYFECDNGNSKLRPGQRIGVQLALVGEDQGITAPRKSIIYDIYGGTWVYVQTADHVFERRRVLIRYMMGDRVVLAEGPAADTQVVTDGAAELFGTEFGSGK